ncbi:MAG: DsbA family protein [Methanobacteriota archaeon]|nr:MAG: DsbA family protein [Euryarchaeota archaeon]
MIETEVLVRGPEGGPGKLRLVEYTDPYSIWCWGCEPAVRRVEWVYAGSVDLEIRMGGLFEDFTPMREQFARMSGGQWKDSVLAFMNAVAEHHRMPMDPAAMMDTIEDFRSTWPACEAVKAAELQGVPVGRRYLRRLREAALVEGQAIHRRAVQEKLASEVGLRVRDFMLALADGTARRAFEADLETCRAHGVTGFPTFECGTGDVSLRIEGWQPWEAIDDTLRKMDPSLKGDGRRVGDPPRGPGRGGEGGAARSREGRDVGAAVENGAERLASVGVLIRQSDASFTSDARFWGAGQSPAYPRCGCGLGSSSPLPRTPRNHGGGHCRDPRRGHADGKDLGRRSPRSREPRLSR